MRVQKTLLTTASLAWLMAGTVHAQAQTMPAPEVNEPVAETTNVDEIVVTAQRRSESVQKTALAVAAISGETLTSQGVRTAQDLQSQVPGLQIAPQIFGNLQIFLRGVGSTANTESGDPAIAFHMDGAYVSRTTSTAGLLFDINRIEVVKGPQGTLYGRNATGGSVNVITNKPTWEYSGGASVEFGNYNALLTGGYLNLPLNDTLAARLSFQTARHDGYVKAVDGALGTAANDRQDQEDTAARLHILYKPNDRFSLLVSGDYSHQGGAGGGDQRLPLTTGDPYEVNGVRTVSRDNEFVNGQIEANYDFGFATLTYIGASRTSRLDRDYEYPITGYPGHLFSRNQTISHELRLGGETERLIWVAGLYRFEEDTKGDLALQITPTLRSERLYTGQSFTSDSSAAFGQVTYRVTDRLRVTGGLRYNEDEKYRPDATGYIRTLTGTTLSTSFVAASSGSWNSTSWKTGVEYDLAPNSLAYANIGTAYKAGGIFEGSTPNTYEPEDMIAYEIGLKNRLLDRRLTLNLAAYYYDYSNLQVAALDNDNGVPRSITRNAGAAIIQGAEVEFAYASDLYGRVNGSVAYTDAKYDNFILPLGDSWTNYGTTTQTAADYSGQRMPLAPEWSINLGYEYGFSIMNGTITARVQTHYESGKFMDFHEFAQTYQDAYFKTDLSATYAPNDADWKIQGYVRNLEDDAVLASAIPPISQSPDLAQVFYAAPRTYGVRISAEF